MYIQQSILGSLETMKIGFRIYPIAALYTFNITMLVSLHKVIVIIIGIILTLKSSSYIDKLETGGRLKPPIAYTLAIIEFLQEKIAGLSFVRRPSRTRKRLLHDSWLSTCNDFG